MAQEPLQLGPAPAPITLKDTVPLSVDLHPSADLLAAGLITGQVNCYSYTDTTSKRLFGSKHHKDSVRCVKFSHDGAHLYSCSTDKSIQVMDTETKQVFLKKAKAHDDGINTLLPLNETLVASGDENGVVRVWDLRAKNIVQEWHEHEDLVTDLHFVPHKKTIVSTGADGYLSVYDLRKKDVVARSDQMEVEMLCVAPVRNGKRLVVGNSDGSLSIWSWGWWGDFKDRFPGHPASVDTVVAIADDMVVTGCADGLVRVLSIHPNKLLGVLGAHDEFPIESLAQSHDKRFLVSCSHDHTIRFWNASILHDSGSDDDEPEGQEEGADPAAGDGSGSDGWESASGDEDGDADDADEDEELADSDDEADPSRAAVSDDDEEDPFAETADDDLALGAAPAPDSAEAPASADESESSSSDEEPDDQKKRKKKKGILKRSFEVKKPKKDTFYSGL
ncbi:WD domain repeat-containing protein 55 [Allomyces javanicus]|nr:WD domain repeat-containing protein 55 [Allomyces javanicus]